ncbi:MAG TPA: D-alanyl-D-alanine carboxypeptidase [Mycobacteriales bacterium]|nr:D-alanyl-D-alanine carboxypeptidase [Mycobacteriales bacterium]
MLHRRRHLTGSAVLVASAVAIVAAAHGRTASAALPRALWPAYGEAAYAESGSSQLHASPKQRVVPIASVAKVMTAYVVLRDHPLLVGEQGPTITLSAADVADYEARRSRGESVVAVAAGERLSELQALQALLLPSANNIAAVLAAWDDGSVARFVDGMNAGARLLGMTHTRYTDPSGYDDSTVSTAADQVKVVEAAMQLPVFASVVAMRSAWLPVAGTVYNTDTLLGRDGFVGVKTGSDSAAGGCFAFRAVRAVNGKPSTITGVVLGQPGRDELSAGLEAAASLVERITRLASGRPLLPRGASPSGAPPP